MSSAPNKPVCDQAEQVCAYALQALPAHEVAAVEAHLAECDACQHELDNLGPVLDALPVWPTDVLRPPRALQERLAQRLADETGSPPVPPPQPHWNEPGWENVAPGISCKMLAVDPFRSRISMLVRLAPGGEYPPHTHAGVEELHLLDGQLWINERKLYPGDYSRAVAGTADARVWSETGCTCVLITSTDDQLA